MRPPSGWPITRRGAAVNIESGSASHLDFVVWYMWVQEQYGYDTMMRTMFYKGL